MTGQLPDLERVLRLGRRELVAAVGAGGKTTVLLELARQLEGNDRVARLGTTTMAAVDEVAALRHFVYDRREGDRLLGVGPEHFDALHRQGWVDVVAVEADHAPGFVAKAPAAGAPRLPRTTTHVLGVIGAGALDRVIASCGQHPVRIAAIAGCRPYERLTPERAALLLTSPEGGRRGLPPMARYSVVVSNVAADDEPLVDRLVAALKVLDPRITVICLPVLQRAAPLAADVRG